MSARKSTKRRWRHRRGDNYWYWQDDRYGYGHVIRHGKSYDASGTSRLASFTRLRDAKAFVERYSR